ncbi:MAG TPA: hypothetical protein VMR62_04610 [Bryobacteraceae bacterium]|nr:hypothetical protein [Bryobacteraceae bacterium]
MNSADTLHSPSRKHGYVFREGVYSAAAAMGSYCPARQKIPKLIVGEVMDRMVEQLRAEMQEGWAGLQRPVMRIDGSSLLLQHSRNWCGAFHPGTIHMGRTMGR